MQKQIFNSWFAISIFIINFVSILTFDINERQTFTSKFDNEKKLSSHQNKYERFILPQQLLKNHTELIFPESTKKVLQILSESSLLSEKTINVTHMSTSKNIDRHKEEESTFDDDLFLLSSNNGKERKNMKKISNNTNTYDEDKKTLSEQVKEGKYGLIQNEIYAIKSNRPGIISYSLNSEIPHDTDKNLGGLDKEEIWLAENHVLVLKGGNFPELNMAMDQTDNEWPPIDNYKAPRRQIKIPSNPRIPPPFPVQLIEGGPIQLIDIKDTNLTKNKTTEILSGNFRDFLSKEGPYFSILSIHNNSKVNSDFLESPKKKTKTYEAITPSHPALPPGTVIIPPRNQTENDDEDQSIYYPPPYSFVYLQENSTTIPPGPLVPGIILPPPPDFFSSLDEKEGITNEKYTKNSNITSKSTPITSYLSTQKSTTKFYKIPFTTVSSIKTNTFSYHSEPLIKTKLKNSIFHQYQSKKLTTKNYQTIPFVEVTTPIPRVSTTSNKLEKYNIQQMVENQINNKSAIKSPWKAIVSSKSEQFVTFSPTTVTSIDESVQTTPSSIILTTENPSHYPSQASYYFYEECNNEKSHTSTSIPVVFFSTTTEIPQYYNLEISQQPHLSHYQLMQQQQRQGKKFYNEEIISSQHFKDYKIKLIDSTVKEPHTNRYFNSGIINSQEKLKPLPVKEHNSQILHSDYRFLSTHLAPKWHYFTTQKPKIFYQKPVIENLKYKQSSSKSKPIYQYSFEATNFAKQRAQMLIQKSYQKQLPLYNEYQDFQSTKHQYDNINNMINNKQEWTQKVPFFRGKKNERQPYYRHSTTLSPIYTTTLASHQQYFTKQDEKLLDDVTKEYFTVFGKKISSNKLPSTTPLYGKSAATNIPQFYNINDYESRQYDRRKPNIFTASNIKVRYGDQLPGSFGTKDNIIINYKNSLPLPNLSTNSDFISLINMNPQSTEVTKKSQSIFQLKNQIKKYALSSVPDIHKEFYQIQPYENAKLKEHQQQNPQQDTLSSFRHMNKLTRVNKESEYSQGPLSLESDIPVNYQNSRLQINPNTKLNNQGMQSNLDSNTNKHNSYFAYTFPGGSGHFYFLTPQTIKREDPDIDYLHLRPKSNYYEEDVAKSVTE